MEVINSPTGIVIPSRNQEFSVVEDLEDDDDNPSVTATSSSEQRLDIVHVESTKLHTEGSVVQSSLTSEGESSLDNLSLEESNACDSKQHIPMRVVVGNIKNKSQEVIFEPNNTESVSHPNMGIIGTMGTGKTQFARSLIAQLAKEGENNVGGNPVGLLVFDYKGDYKDKEFLNTVEGSCYRSNYPFNPLKLIVNEEVEGLNLPAITADKIADSFAKAYGLGLKQQSNIKQVIISTYEDAGITRDASTWGKLCPTMNDVIKKYFDTYDANDKAYALFDKLNDYTIFTDDVNQCVSIFGKHVLQTLNNYHSATYSQVLYFRNNDAMQQFSETFPYVNNCEQLRRVCTFSNVGLSSFSPEILRIVFFTLYGVFQLQNGKIQLYGCFCVGRSHSVIQQVSQYLTALLHEGFLTEFVGSISQFSNCARQFPHLGKSLHNRYGRLCCDSSLQNGSQHIQTFLSKCLWRFG